MQVIKGTIASIVFRNDENGYTVMSVERAVEGQIRMDERAFTAVGSIADANVGEDIEMTGDWVEHNEYGLQFKFAQARVAVPDTEESIERYLGSGLIKGIGKATAKNIVRVFGDKALYILETQPHRLSEVKGISPSRAQNIAESFSERAGARSSIMALQSHGMTSGQAVKLHKQYGPDAYDVIRENPYRLIDDIPGIGFRTADTIAQKMGFLKDSEFRVSAGIRYTLQWARTDGGHTCLPREKLLSLSARSLEVELERCERALDEMIIMREVIYNEIDGVDMIFLNYMFRAESECARRLIDLRSNDDLKIPLDLEQELQALERDSAIRLDDTQRSAVLGAFASGVQVITGGPGTGKTTIITFILKLIDKLSLVAELCAPTGRAAKRMSEATGGSARTIHRMLEYTGERFGRGVDDPLEADVYIVDEASMIDASLFLALLRALPENARLVLVGDADQLPSVGAGRVLGDIIDSGVVPVLRLEQIFRQARMSRIVVNAHRINHGEMPLLDFVEDFAFEECSNQEAILRRIAGICERGKLGDPWSEVQILSPTKKGTLGVRNINATLQRTLNPPSIRKAERLHGETLFRVGDKVMQIKNNYSIGWSRPTAAGTEAGTGAFNGDLGLIMAIYDDDKTVEVLFDDDRTAFYDHSQLDELDLAYCISIHKAQGSEFPIILMPLCGGSPMLMTRNLLYTAVTRARRCVVIIGRRSTIDDMISNAQENDRYSALCPFLRKMDTIFSGGLPWPEIPAHDDLDDELESFSF